MNKLSPWILIAAGLFSAGAMAQMDVDEADSLNFKDFHKDKKEAIKVWEDGVGQRSDTIKAYDQGTPAATTPTTATDSSSITSVAKPAAASQAPAGTSGAAAIKSAQTETKPGQRYEIRERYTLSRSAKTPYSAFYVIEPLHKQAYQLCPRGWKKVAERSEPVEQDYWQYFQVECL